MALSEAEPAVEHQPALARFAIVSAAGTAVLEYRRDGQRVLALHTGVPEALRGRGHAARLTAALVEWCRAEHLLLVPRCSYTAAWAARHPQAVSGLLAER